MIPTTLIVKVEITSPVIEHLDETTREITTYIEALRGVTHFSVVGEIMGVDAKDVKVKVEY